MASGNNLFSLEQIEVKKTSVDITLIFEEIHKEIRDYLIDKKRFVKALTQILALLLNAKVDTAGKIKRTLKIAVETKLKI